MLKLKTNFNLSYLIFFLILFSLFCTQTTSYNCPPQCKGCFGDNPFSCSSCQTNPITNQKTTSYVWSCQYFVKNSPFYVVLCLFIVILDVFMLMVGFGVYQSVYQQIQMISILLWVQPPGGNPVITLQGTNFAIQFQNYFVNTFGPQFIFFLFIFLIFGVMVMSYQKIAHNPIAVLIRRKRIIFPTRIINMLLIIIVFSSLNSIATTQSIGNINIFELILSIIALSYGASMYVTLFYICNFKDFKLDDPNYYVICEKIASTRWWIKNKLFFQATLNILFIIIFVFGFSNAQACSVVIIVFQFIYTFYIFLFVPYVKIRYKIFNLLGCIFFIIILICLNGQISATLSSNISLLNRYNQVYTAFIILLCFSFILSLIIQIFIMRNQIGRQLRSFKNRFILCDTLDKQIQMTKYDAHSNRQKVVQFYNNEIYRCDLSDIRKKLGQNKFEIGDQASSNNYNTTNNYNPIYNSTNK